MDIEVLLKGNVCFPALVTPFDSLKSNNDALINYDAMNKLVNYVLKNGADGVVIAGCTGSSFTLSSDEQVSLVKYVNKNFRDKTVVIGGDGSNRTQEAINLAQRIEKKAGVYTHLSINPYGNKPGQKGIYQHYEEIAKAIKGNIILYNIPSRTGGQGIMPETVAELAKLKKIIGIKEACGDLERIAEVINRTRDKDFFVLSGDDFMTYDIMEKGGIGTISGGASIYPKSICEMVHNFDINREYSQYLNEKMKKFYNVMFKLESNPQPAHYALRKMGINVGVSRRPMIDIEDETKEKVDKVLLDLKLI